MSDMISFTPARAWSFKVSYDMAVENNLEQFTWDGHEFLTAYAKYMLIHLADQGCFAYPGCEGNA